MLCDAALAPWPEWLRALTDKNYAALRRWTLADYQNLPEPYCEYFKRDPNFGLAALREDFDRWHGAAMETRQSNQGALDAAIRKRLDEGDQPGLTVPWEQFCDAVQDDTHGWVDRKQRRAKRGYGDKTIKWIVKEQRLDKQDK